jgi:hypothetical protein
MNMTELEGWDRQLRTLTNGQAIAAAFVDYVAIAGAALAGTMERLATIVTANETLEGFHRQRKAAARGT